MDLEGEPALLLFLLAVASEGVLSDVLSLELVELELGCELSLDRRAVAAAVSVCCSSRIAIDAPASLRENLHTCTHVHVQYSQGVSM